MTPKEKAADIVDKYIQLLPYHSKESNLKRAKASALIAVDEIIKILPQNEYLEDRGEMTENRERIYWQEVKQEINNL